MLTRDDPGARHGDDPADVVLPALGVVACRTVAMVGS
jgi:hypothetical protein